MLARAHLRQWRVRITGSGDAEWSFDSLQLVFLHEAWMRRVSHIKHAWLEETGDVFAAKAIANATNLVTSQRATHLLENSTYDGIDMSWIMVLQPFHDLETLRAVHGHRIVVEQIGHDDKVAISSILVSDELRVDELVPYHVGEDEDSVGGALVLRVGHVCWGFSRLVIGKREIEADALLPTVVSSPFASPS